MNPWAKLSGRVVTGVTGFIGSQKEPSAAAKPPDAREARAANSRLERFWLSYFRTGFVVLIGEVAVGLVYFILTPHGPHRPALIALGIASVLVALAGFSAVRHVAPLSLRSEIFAAWVLYAGIVMTLSAYLDRGIDSPLTVLFVLPLAAAALGLSLRNVIICGVASLAELAFVWSTDPSKGSATAETALLTAAVTGMGVFAVGFTVARSRMQQEQTMLEDELTFRAERDLLTGCLNHGTFYDRLGVEIDRSIRHHEPLSLLMVDVDLFKAFNDAYGHIAGDEALGRIGELFRDLSRSFDLVGRVGGDEFAIALPNTSEDHAYSIALRLKERVARTCAPLTVSIGSATLDESSPTAAQLVRSADASLYGAKSSGRDRVARSTRDGAPNQAPRQRAGRRDADLRVAEERVRESDRARAEALSILDAYQATTSVGLGFVDTEFRIIRANPMLASVRGGSVDDQIGLTVEEVVPDLWPQLEPKYRSVIDTGTSVVNLEVSGATADDPGVRHWWLTNLYPVKIEDQIIGIGTVVLDITDRKNLEASRVQLTRSVVAALAEAVEMRDPYTAGHESRVSINATLVATQLGLDVDEVESIGLAGHIHDIGKLAVPAEILSHPGRLSEVEMELVRTHPQAGSDMLERVGFPREAREIVLQHHVRIDGSGYPSGLRGDEVCIGAQIVAVADVFDAIVSTRPYRGSLGLDAALEELARGSGTRYNAEAVAAFIRLVKANIITA